MVSSISDVLLTTLHPMDWQKDTFKKAMLAGDRERCDLKYRLNQFLF